MKYEINPKIIFTKLLYFIIILMLANIAGIVSKLYFDHDYAFGLIPLFNFNTESNIPTLYSSFALIFVSILLSFIAITHKRLGSTYLYWVGLAIIFLFLSIDESALIHERVSVLVNDKLNTSGFFQYGWIIPYGIALVVFVSVYLKFLMDLPKKIMILFVVSGATYTLGALGFEAVGGKIDQLYGQANLLYSIIYTCEEFLEMLGIVIFIYTLLEYIVNQFGFLRISTKIVKSMKHKRYQRDKYIRYQ